VSGIGQGKKILQERAEKADWEKGRVGAMKPNRGGKIRVEKLLGKMYED